MYSTVVYNVYCTMFNIDMSNVKTSKQEHTSI